MLFLLELLDVLLLALARLFGRIVVAFERELGPLHAHRFPAQNTAVENVERQLDGLNL